MSNPEDDEVTKNGNEKDEELVSEPEPEKMAEVESTGEEVEIVEHIVEYDGEIPEDKYKDVDLDDEENFKDVLKDFTEMEDFDDEDIMELSELSDEDLEDIDTLDLDDEDVILGEDSIDEVETEEIDDNKEQEDPYEGWGLYTEEFQPQEISDDLEAKIQEELAKKRKKKEMVSEETFIKKCSEKRNKVWYHALWFLVFDVEDHESTKKTLYEALSEATSNSAIDPLPEHKFYFGLGFILRLKLMDKKVVEFDGEKLKVNKRVGIDHLTELLYQIGDPISERPTISKDKKKQMYLDFLTDDFSDI